MPWRQTSAYARNLSGGPLGIARLARIDADSGASSHASRETGSSRAPPSSDAGLRSLGPGHPPASADRTPVTPTQTPAPWSEHVRGRQQARRLELRGRGKPARSSPSTCRIASLPELEASKYAQPTFRQASRSEAWRPPHAFHLEHLRLAQAV